MDIGTGIAIAGAWLFAGMLGISPNVSSFGMWIGIIISATITVFLTLIGVS